MDEQWMASLFQFPQKDCRELFSVFDESLMEGDREGRGDRERRIVSRRTEDCSGERASLRRL
jgi:hypothetical protein